MGDLCYLQGVNIFVYRISSTLEKTLVPWILNQQDVLFVEETIVGQLSDIFS